eukprot:COSAG02_NODE_577_length_20095_cov_6.816413_21_plen_67_part_00
MRRPVAVKLCRRHYSCGMAVGHVERLAWPGRRCNATRVRLRWSLVARCQVYCLLSNVSKRLWKSRY